MVVAESAAGADVGKDSFLGGGQMMATLMPMGMIFVPSARGISHSPKELTSWVDCSNGANVCWRVFWSWRDRGRKSDAGKRARFRRLSGSGYVVVGERLQFGGMGIVMRKGETRTDAGLA